MTKRLENFKANASFVTINKKRFLTNNGRKKVYTTNSPLEIAKYFEGKELLFSYKTVGQPITLHYSNGNLIGADICNDGITGFRVINAASVIKTVPKTIPTKEAISVRGTVFFTWKDYNEICCFFQDTERKPLPPKETVTQLLLREDSVLIVNFNVQFMAYDLHTTQGFERKTQIFKLLKKLGFPTVQYKCLNKGVKARQLRTLQICKSGYHYYPTSGLIFESEQLFYNDFDPNTRMTMALAWPFDVNKKEYIGTQRLLGEFGLLPFSK